jgi:hypothetical protein
MTSTEYREWAAREGIAEGSMVAVECEGIAEAEAYVSDFPRDAHDLATCGSVEVEYTSAEDTRRRLREMLIAAGYTPAEDGWQRDGYTVSATYHESLRYAMIYVYSRNNRMALAAGAGGYLHPSDRPTMG